MRSASSVLYIVGFALVALGLYLGSATISRHSTHCGSAFGGVSAAVAEKDQKIADDVDVDSLARELEGRPQSDTPPADPHRLADACSTAVSDRLTLSLILLVPGLAMLASGVVVARSARRQNRTAPNRKQF